MILQDMRRHLFRTLYYVYDVYEEESAVSEESKEEIESYSQTSYWAAPDYKVESGEFVLIDPRAVHEDFPALVGMWTMRTDGGTAVNKGETIYRVGEETGYYREFEKYTNEDFGYRPGKFIRSERTTEPKYPVNGPSGSYWYQLAGITDSRETEWYWVYNKNGAFVPHTSGIYRVICIGGGGGGGSGGGGHEDLSGAYGGGGGGSGYAGTVTVRDVLLKKGVSYQITIGKAGNGGGPGEDGRDGTESTFDTLVTGNGGYGGSSGGVASRGSGGSGGSGQNRGGKGGRSLAGSGGETAIVGDSRYSWRYPNGKGGAGGNGTTKDASYSDGKGHPGENGTQGVVIVEFRSL